jgi:lipopolysaccharide export LptBFGC system permease protein LptF
MMPLFSRLPITLWLATLADMLKLVALSASVLVLVIALGAAVKPLSDGVLQAQDLIRFVAVAIVPMLAYALPFAGGFAATLVYYRIAHENEAIGAYAGGISHRSLLAPALLTAAILTVALMLLNEQVIPVFLREMQKMVTIDVARQIMHGVEKGQAIQLKGATKNSAESRMMIYADGAQALEPDKASGALEEVMLRKFAAVELTKEGEPDTEVTAQIATMWLYPGNVLVIKGKGAESEESRSLVFMRLENVVAVQQGKWVGRQEKVDIPWTVPNAFTDKVSFLSYSELRTLKDVPEKLNWVEGNRQRLAQVLAERQAIARMRQGISEGKPITLVDGGGRPLTIHAGVMIPEPQPGVAAVEGAPPGNRWIITPLPGKHVDVDMVRGSVSGDSAASISAERAVLSNDPTSGPHRLEFRLDLERAMMRDPTALADPTAQAERAMISIQSLTPSPNPLDQLLKLSAHQLLKEGEQWTATVPGDELDHSPRQFAKDLAQIKRMVLSKQNERMAMALSCAVMVLTGAITALLLSKKLPLTVYLWTFFPAVATMVTISGGQQVTSSVGPPGLILMWSGVAALGLYTLLVFSWLSRH